MIFIVIPRRLSHHYAVAIDSKAGTQSSSKRAEVNHSAVGVKKRVGVRQGRGVCVVSSRDLTSPVNAVSSTVEAQGPQVNHRASRVQKSMEGSQKTTRVGGSRDLPGIIDPKTLAIGAA